MCNPKISAQEAMNMGLINQVVPDEEELAEETRAFALEVAK